MTLYTHILLIILLLLIFKPPFGFNPIRSVRPIQSGGAANAGNSWHRDSSCKYKINSMVRKVFKLYSIAAESPDGWSIHLPCTYNNVKKELLDIKPTDPSQKIFLIKGCDNLSRKDNIWSNLVNAYGRARASKYMPMTYLTETKASSDLALFKKDYTAGDVYILKKNKQRQQGLKVLNNYEEIMSSVDDGYVIIQHMLQDPYIINGRKTNCRVYLLIVCHAGEKKAYMYDNGFMYYSRTPFKPNSVDMDRIITTGYGDRAFYQKNPLTLKDMVKHVGPKVDIISRGKDLLRNIWKACNPVLCSEPKGKMYKNITFQLFGCDVAYNDKLVPQLIEINKGPDLSGKDERDSALKFGLVEDIFRTIGVITDDMMQSGGSLTAEGSKGSKGSKVRSNGFMEL